jgi:hypothetical protein
MADKDTLDKVDKAVDTAGKVSQIVKAHTNKPNKFVEVVRQLSEVITEHGMAPTSFACGIGLVSFVLLRFQKISDFASYSGVGVGCVLIVVGVTLYVWKIARETPRVAPPPPPLDPEFVKTLELVRRLAARDLPPR